MKKYDTVADDVVTAYTASSSAPVNGIVTGVVAGIGNPVPLVTPDPPIHDAALAYTSACVMGAGPAWNNFVAVPVAATCPLETAITCCLSLS
jgi:hypothetical protein